MKSTEPGFWGYFWAYLLICAGTVVILSEIVEWAWFGTNKKLSLGGGLIAIWLGIMFLSLMKKSKQEPPKPVV
ncbi:MAG: hypothetical protein WC980_06175 [Candidatus Brocadiia bacterium]